MSQPVPANDRDTQGHMPARPILALLTDFGIRDTFVGVMQGVILGIAPMAHIVDLTHAVPVQDIATGMWMLGMSYRYFPAGTVFVGVVDPGVGSERSPLAVHAGEWYFVGPDNGLFTMIYQQQTVHQAVALTNHAYHLPHVSATFQGRDVFSPVAAHIATGVPLSELGPALDPQALQRLDTAPAQQVGQSIKGSIVYADQFGNLISNIPASLLPAQFFVRPDIHLDVPARGVRITERRRYFAEQTAQTRAKDEPFLYIDSANYLGIAVQNGSAAAKLAMGVGESIMLSF